MRESYVSVEIASRTIPVLNGALAGRKNDISQGLGSASPVGFNVRTKAIAFHGPWPRT